MAIEALGVLLFVPESADRVRYNVSDTLQEGAGVILEALRRQVNDRLGPS